ncbi:MAG TPA: hypothetical protein VIJ22_00215 [Polyangiaceae bacterium]
MKRRAVVVVSLVAASCAPPYASMVVASRHASGVFASASATAPEPGPAPTPAPAPAPSPAPPSGPVVYDLDDAAPHLSFRLTLAQACDAADWTCERAADLDVYRKDAAGHRVLPALQTEHFDDVILEGMPPGGPPLVNTARLYDAQGVLIVGDFDFDGRDDFAVQVGHDGPYGGPTFAVYLDTPAKGRFVEAAAFSELTRTTLGMFGVDAKHRHITTIAKSGCCWHEWITYAVVRRALVPVATHTESIGFGEDNVLTTTDERLAGGRWRTTTTTRPYDVSGH